MELLTTSFGAPWASPRRTAAVLRAKAAASGVALAEVSETDLAAAVAGAHVWCATMRIFSLDGVRLAPSAARRAAAAILARAAGDASRRAAVPDDVRGRAVGGTYRCETAIEEARRWVSSLDGVDVVAVLSAAAADLSAGVEDIELEQAVTLLLASMETHSAV